MYWLSDTEIAFPSPEYTSDEGILALGGDLSPNRLLLAYEWGIFPWFSEGDPIMWWHPDPRFVLFPEKLKVSKSMRPYFNQQKYHVTYDKAFTDVINHCGNIPRRDQEGYDSWITNDMKVAYTELHRIGYAHSVEVWQKDELVGGLYGIALGKVFFGESMFAKATNASKFGFITLVRALQLQGFQLIDCQQETPHLESLGAESISRTEFLDYLKKNRQEPFEAASWQQGVR